MSAAWRVVLLAAALAVAAQAGEVIDQGRPGNQGPWPVTLSGSGTVSINFDGGFIGQTVTAPCSTLRQTNDAGIGTTPTRIPTQGPLAGRIWVQVCNDYQNTNTAVCKCSSTTCPASSAVSAIGDSLATGDCAMYNLGIQDAGVPCCVCNGAGVFLPVTECAP